MKRWLALLLLLPLLLGFARFNGSQSNIVTLTPGSNFPQAVDTGNPSVSRWSDPISAATRQTPTGSPGEAGHLDNVVAVWDGPFPRHIFGASGNYTLNGQPGVLVCVHAGHVSNVPTRWSGTTPSPNQLIYVQFAVDGGSFAAGNASAPMTNPLTFVRDNYCSFTPMSALADGEHEWRAYACAATGYCAYLSSVKNVTENYPVASSGTLYATNGSAISTGTLVSGAETVVFTGLQALGFTITNATYNSGTGIETLTYNYNGAPLNALAYFVAGQLINVQGITGGTGNWNAWAAKVVTGTTKSPQCTTNCTVTFNNSAGAPGGTPSFPCSGSPIGCATVSDYNATIMPGQTISVQGATTTAFNTTGACEGGGNVCATVLTSWCYAPLNTAANNCAATFTNGAGSASWTGTTGTITTDEAQFIDPGQHRVVSSSGNELVDVTGSSDANITPFAYTGNGATMAGVYCVAGYLSGHPANVTSGETAMNPGALELIDATFSSTNWRWGCGSSTGTITGVSYSTNSLGIPLQTITYTDSSCWRYPPGDTVTVAGALPSSTNSTKVNTVYSWSCSGGNATIVLINTAGASGSYTGGPGTIVDPLPTANVISDGTGQSMVLVEHGGGANKYYDNLPGGNSRLTTVSQNSLFLFTNKNGGITTKTAYVDSVAGLNGSTTATTLPLNNCQTGSANPVCQTIDVAVPSLASVSELSPNTQALDNTSIPGCLAFKVAGNSQSNATPIAVGQPVTFSGASTNHNMSGATTPFTMVANQGYWVTQVSGQAVALAETPGGTCINDTFSHYPANMDLLADPSFDSIVLECTNPANCPTGKPQQFYASSAALFGIGFGTNFGWTNLVISANTQITGAKAGSISAYMHVVGNQANVWDIDPASLNVTSTADIPPLANVGPGLPNGVIVTGGTAVAGSPGHITLNYTSAYSQPYAVGTSILTNGIVTSASNWNAAINFATVSASSCAGTSCTVTYPFTVTASTYVSGGGIFNGAMSGYPAPTPVTSATGVNAGGGGVNITFSYTDTQNKVFQAISGAAAQVLKVTGSVNSDWNCTGTVPSGGASPSTCYITASSCNGSGSCQATYFNSSATTTGTFSDTALNVSIQTIAIPVNIPFTAGCTAFGATGCVPPSGVTTQTSTTVPTGVTPVGPGGGFPFYETGTTANTTLVHSGQSCIPYIAGESDPGMGGLTNFLGPPGDQVWVTSLATGGGNIQDIILTYTNAATLTNAIPLGFLNWADCPAGTTFAFNSNNAYTMFNANELWLDNVKATAATNLVSQIATPNVGMYVNNSNIAFTETNSFMTEEIDSINSYHQSCWPLFYVIENSLCYGQSTVGPSVASLLVASPTLPPLSPLFGQPTTATQATQSISPQGGTPYDIGIGWNATVVCKDGGGLNFSRDLWVTGFNSTQVFFSSGIGPSSGLVQLATIPNDCTNATVTWDAGIHTDFYFVLLNNAPYGNGVNFPAPVTVNAVNQVGFGFWAHQAANNYNAIYDADYEWSNFGLDEATASGQEFRVSGGQSNMLFLNDIFSRNGVEQPGTTNPMPGDVFVINPTPNYQITGITSSGSGINTIETVSYTDATNTPRKAGEIVSVYGTATLAQFDGSNNTLWGAVVLGAPNAPSCGGGTCQLSFVNPYSPTLAHTTGTLMIVTNNNPGTWGAFGCPVLGTWTTGITPGVKVYPAEKGTSWSASGGINDIPPWYELLSGSGVGNC